MRMLYKSFDHKDYILCSTLVIIPDDHESECIIINLDIRDEGNLIYSVHGDCPSKHNEKSLFDYLLKIGYNKLDSQIPLAIQLEKILFKDENIF